MDEAAFNETVERLKKVNGIITKLDPVIRAEAFELLAPYVTGGQATDDRPPKGDGTATTPRKGGGGAVDYDVLIEKFESDKDADNAMLSLAICLDRHGRGPFQMRHIKDVAQEFSLSVADRLDMTFKGAKRDGKEVLRKQTDGWKITPSGEAWLKTTYGVSRGKEPLPDDDGS